MSYTTHVSGGFAIEPPLTWQEFKDSPYSPIPPAGDARLELVLGIAEETVDTDDGPLLRRTASALVMSEIDEYRAYGLIDAVQAAVDSFPGHEWSGRLECEGKENTDIWRVIIRNGRALKIEPRIVWPEDGAE